MHILHTLTVFRAGGDDDVNACGVNAAVTEDVRKFGNILFDGGHDRTRSLSQSSKERLRNSLKGVGVST